jgi:hypothetical protein
VNSRELIRWQGLAESRARSFLTSSFVLALIAGGAIAGWVAWRQDVSPLAGSNAWFAVTLVAFATAFMRVPFHIYWRHDASLLAQLPIEGASLFDAALLRCVRAAVSTTIAVAIGAIPIATISTEIYLRHVAMAAALGTAAAGLIPAVAIWAAQLVAIGQRDDRIQRARAAAGITQTPAHHRDALVRCRLASTFIFVGVILGYRWLTARDSDIPTPLVLAAIAGISIVALLATRRSAPRMMGTILRDVSALDRQRLAHLEIRPPTGIEKLIGGMLGAGALPYSKDARLVRRRYPMAFVLGALAFLVLGIVGVAEPDDPGPWMTVTLAGAAAYGVVLAGRLRIKPIELPRLTSTLPIEHGVITRAKVAWIIGWWTIFVAVPGVFAVVRQADVVPYAALLGGATVVVFAAAIAYARR